MSKTIDRRDFLKYSFMFFANSYFLSGKALSKYSLPGKQQQDTGKLGRVLFDGVQAYTQPDTQSEIVDTYSFNDVIDYQQEISINSGHPRNEIWCKISNNNYIQSINLQPVKNQTNEVVKEIRSSGQLAEITVPYTTAIVNKWNGNQEGTQDQIFFYGSTHWVYGLYQDQKGETYYYLVKEDRWEDSYFVDATHMRLINDQELDPTSTSIDQNKKVIRIYLREQYLVAYENEEPVLMCPLSSGQLSGSTDLTTPTGTFSVNYKRPSRHMVHSDRIGINDNELYGVPWVTYFTDSGIAFHGTYWHNDFGQPKSHGCINLPIPAARWLYLWTQPVVPPGEKKYVSNKGTQVEVY